MLFIGEKTKYLSEAPARRMKAIIKDTAPGVLWIRVQLDLAKNAEAAIALAALQHSRGGTVVIEDSCKSSNYLNVEMALKEV